MSTTSTTGRRHATTSAPARPLLRAATTGAGVAVLVNAVLWSGGRAADVPFLVTPVGLGGTMRVGLVTVVLTTALAFAVGVGLLALAARRSRTAVRAVVVAAGLVAAVSACAPPSVAQDPATGVLLAAMHVVTGVAFLVTAATVTR